MKPTLSHIWLLVEDIAQSRRFYCDLLGFEVVNNLDEFVELNAHEQVLLSLFGRQAMLASEPHIPLDPRSGQRAVFALEVSDLDRYCAALRTKGVPFVSDLTNHPEWGLRTGFLADPDGNLLCLYGGIPADE